MYKRNLSIRQKRQLVQYIVLAALLAALLVLFFNGRARLPAIQPIAYVNHTPISAALYQTALADLIADKQTPPSAAEKQQLLERLIDDELLIQKGIEDGLLITDAEIRTLFADKIRAQLAAQATQANISEADLRAYFAERQDQFTPSAQIQLSRIFVRGAHTDAQARLAAIRAALRRGEDFDEVGARLGDATLPAIPQRLMTLQELRTHLGPALTQRVVRLETGTITDAIRAGSGWHFLYIIQRVKGVAVKFEDIKDEVASQYRKQAIEADLANLLAELRKSATIRILPIEQ